MKLLRRFAILLGLATAATVGAQEVEAPKIVESEEFSVGEIWSYKTRPGEEDSRVLIGRIESLPTGETAVHIRIVKLKLRSPASPTGFSPEVGHAPISEAALRKSVVARESGTANLEGFSDGYETWLAAYLKGEAGVFSGTVSEIVEWIEGTLSP